MRETTSYILLIVALQISLLHKAWDEILLFWLVNAFEKAYNVFRFFTLIMTSD